MKYAHFVSPCDHFVWAHSSFQPNLSALLKILKVEIGTPSSRKELEVEDDWTTLQTNLVRRLQTRKIPSICEARQCYPILLIPEGSVD